MSRLRLIHWNAAEARRYREALGTAGYTIEHNEKFESELMRAWRAAPPDAFVVDLSRAPSMGREIAVALRKSPKTRGVPIVFCEGQQEKVARIRSELPDAVYCTFGQLKSALKKALATKLKDPVVPVQMMERYGSRTTAQKLGIQAGSTVRVIDPPQDYLKVLGTLPGDVEVLEDAESAAVTLCYVHDGSDLQTRMSELRSSAAQTRLWFLWKKGQSHRGGVSEGLVRETGLDVGLVDYKICSVDPVWSGMLFARKQR